MTATNDDARDAVGDAATDTSAPDSSGPGPGPAVPEPQPSALVSSRSGSRGAQVLRAAVFILFVLLYSYDLFEAVANLLGVNAQLTEYNVAATKIGLSAVAIPWAILISNVALPPVAFLAAVLLARSRGIGVQALVLLAGLSLVAALTLTFSSLV